MLHLTNMACILQRSLHLSTMQIKSYLKLPNLMRTVTTSKSLASNYEGDGKTTVTFLNREHKYQIMIDGFSSMGFRLNNGIFAIGPLAAFPRTILQWNINSVVEITPESLSLFCLLEPKLDILVIGSGSKLMMPSKDTMQFLKAKNIFTEILPTDIACSTFNFLNSEGRCVAGALIPPEDMAFYPEETIIMDHVKAVDDFTYHESNKIRS